jgi:translation initiation factor eIF-2B subunit delta
MSETVGAVGEEAAPPPATSSDAPSNPPAQANGDAKDAKPAEEGVPKKITPAELKKQKAAEKQARRAQAKSGSAPSQSGPPAKEVQKQQKDAKQASKEDKTRPIPLRRRASQSNTPALPQPKKEAKKDVRQLGLFFGHLYSQPRQHSMVGAFKDVHPAVLALGLQYSSYIVCGSTARMVAMLLAFKAVIDSYHTPVGTSLARHLTNHHLSPQIDYLRSCRPLSISMGNAIRWLKDRKLASTLFFLPPISLSSRSVVCFSAIWRLAPISGSLMNYGSHHQNRSLDSGSRGQTKSGRRD